MKIRRVGAALFYAGGQTERRTCVRKLIVVFSDIVNAPKRIISPFQISDL